MRKKERNIPWNVYSSIIMMTTSSRFLANQRGEDRKFCFFFFSFTRREKIRRSSFSFGLYPTYLSFMVTCYLLENIIFALENWNNTKCFMRIVLLGKWIEETRLVLKWPQESPRFYVKRLWVKQTKKTKKRPTSRKTKTTTQKRWRPSV